VSSTARFLSYTETGQCNLVTQDFEKCPSFSQGFVMDRCLLVFDKSCDSGCMWITSPHLSHSTVEDQAVA